MAIKLTPIRLSLIRPEVVIELEYKARNSTNMCKFSPLISGVPTAGFLVGVAPEIRSSGCFFVGDVVAHRKWYKFSYKIPG